MKYLKYILIVLMFVSFKVKAQQTETKNYVKTITYQVETTDGTVDYEDEKIESITYYDGLGRPIQSRTKQGGGNREDILMPMVYDGFGRQTIQYLPTINTYTPDEGTLRFRTQSALLTDINTYYSDNFPDDMGTIPNPYSESLYDGSPLNRTIQQGAPGEDWAIGEGNEVEFVYSVYDPILDTEVLRYDVSLSFANDIYTPSLSINTTEAYTSEDLTKTITKDENHDGTSTKDRTTEVFKDKNGRVILKRTYDNETEHDTYYVYDDFGNLTYVLPPLFNPTNGLSGTNLNELGYQYKYDIRNRLVEKRIPGRGDWDCIVYNTIDQPILTQDPNMKNDNEWLFTKYDAFGRVVFTGIMSTSSGRSTLQSSVNGTTIQYETRSASYFTNDGVNVYYNNVAYPTVNMSELHTINYYDDYSNMGTLPGSLGTSVTTYYGLTSTSNVKGLATVNKTRVLEATSNEWITTVSYYDDKGRPIYVYSDNPYLGTVDIVETQLDFTGKPIEVKTTHQKSGKADIVTFENFSYDHAGRLISQKQEIVGEPQQLMSKNHYDELGQLYKKEVGGETVFDGYDDVIGLDIDPETGVITKSIAGAWNAGLATKGKILGDGYIEFTPDQNNTYGMVGLSPNNHAVPYFNSIKYAIYAHGNTSVRVYESGSYKGAFTTYQPGDVLRVERVGTTVYYKKNGTTIYTSTVPSTGSLIGDISLHSDNMTISNLKIGHATSDTALQTVDYSYNVRGWLKNINDVSSLGNDLFGFKLNYNTTELNSPNGGALYNGNISETIWKTVNDISSNKTRAYAYDYDDLNRITYADYGIKTTGSYNLSSGYDIEVGSYDLNGNLDGVKRYRAQGELMDHIDYTYMANSNKLLITQELSTSGIKTEGFKDGNPSGNDYAYDENGNMTEDLNKGISAITYNHLNLPVLVTQTNGNIQYFYDALGTKLKKIVAETSVGTTTTDYAGNFVYKQGNLEFFNHPEGYVEPVNASNYASGFDYVFQYKDHLGNIRLSYSDDDFQNDLESDFNHDYSGWVESGSVNYSLEYGRVKANVNSSWEGIKHELSGLITKPGDVFNIKVAFDKGNTVSNVRIYFQELDASGAHLRYGVFDNNLTTGYHEYNYTIIEGTKLRLKIDKDNTYTSSDTYFYVDHVSLSRGDLEIREENNYYPFGLKHKGYNDNTYPFGDHNYGFGGKEEQSELGLEWVDITARNYDAALGRWMNLDPLAEMMRRHSPYNYAFNNPVYFIDPDGMRPWASSINWGPNGGDSEEEKEEEEEEEELWCPSCETDEDWENYYSQAENTASMIGEDAWNGIGGRITRMYDEDGNVLFYLDGKLMDLRKYNNVFHALGSLISDGLLPEAPNRLFKILNFGDETAEATSVAKGGVEFSESSTSAANRLGFEPLDVSINKGVADIPIIFTSEVSLSDISKVTESLKSAGATSINVNTGPVINPTILSRIEKAYNNGRTFLGMSIIKTGDPNNLFILNKKL